MNEAGCWHCQHPDGAGIVKQRLLTDQPPAARPFFSALQPELTDAVGAQFFVVGEEVACAACTAVEEHLQASDSASRCHAELKTSY